MELDEKNKIIFEHLLANARFSLKDLAKILKITKAAVMKRIDSLEKNEFIMRYDAIINWQKLPFIKKVYFVKVQDRDEFERRMKSIPSVFSIISLNGLYNYQVWCFFNNKDQQDNFEMILNHFKNIGIRVDKLVFPRVSFFGFPLKLQLPKIVESEIHLNKIDVTLMKYMAQGHGRDSFYEISKSLKIPYDSVHYHGKNLLRAGYFQSIVAQPGVNKLTLQTTCLLIKCDDVKSSQELFHILQKTQNILSVALIDRNRVMVHFLSQTHQFYRETLSKIINFLPFDKINDVLISHWDRVVLNNRYPLEYLLE